MMRIMPSPSSSPASPAPSSALSGTGTPEPAARELRPLGDPFRPYRSLAAWYCWRAAELYAGAADSALTR